MADQVFTAEWLAKANRLATVAAALSATVHEVNNALQIISGSAEMLGPGITADVLARRTEAIGGQARRASALLAELSAFARDDGTDGAPPARVEIAQIVQRSLAMRQYTLARLHIQASFESTVPLPPAAARPRPVLQIVLNLMLNAEHALAGRQDARILLRAGEHEGRVRLAVEDNGPGPSADDQARLFEPKGDHATGLLGVGLPVAKWLAEREGGTLTAATSVLGGGAFILSLPGL